jgi:holo-[acyl-carrier protein] synthase
VIRGCGIDLVEISRIEQTLKRFGQRFLERMFTPGEREYCLARGSPAQSLAARFAAKEAVAKALGLGLGQFSWQDIEIVRSGAGRPEVRLQGVAWTKAQTLGVERVLVSLSHTHKYAVAQAVAVALV